MKHLILIFACTLLVFSPAAQASDVIPVTVLDWKSGDAAFECSQTLCDADFAWKIDGSPNGDVDLQNDDAGDDNVNTDFPATITISNSDGVTFDWTMDHAVCAVIVKGGTDANIYYYGDGGSFGDTGLHAPLNPNSGKYYDISHITFCFHYGDPDVCYQDETAWGVGSNYSRNGKGSWAMYVDYDYQDTPITVPIRADGGDGVGLDAGTITLQPCVVDDVEVPGFVEITIELDNTFIFYYDLNDDFEDNNIKIQDYSSEPSGNPKIGKFEWKAMADVGSTSYTICVPENDYYGIHLDLAYEVPCDH
jgi:hypothetical protein